MCDADEDLDQIVNLQGDVHNDPDAEAPPSIKMAFGLEADPLWRVAAALETLRKQINALAPSRDKASDGGIGDAKHRSRSSDHNPWVVDKTYGVVTARDFTHSPKTGCDAGVVAESLRASRDKRIKYIIWNRRICASEPKDGQAAWAWRPYTGSNPHDHHVHISVQPEKSLYDDETPFALKSVVALPSLDKPQSADRDVEVAAIAAEADRLTKITPLLQRLTDLGDSPDEAVAQQARGLLGRYLVLIRPIPAPVPPPVPASGAPAAASFSQAALAEEYARLFASCQVRPEWKGQVAWHVKKLLQFRPRYDAIAARTKIPWWVIGAVHAMESSFDFNTHLHNGDPLGARTVQVPKGRPAGGQPPFTWEVSASDALEGHGLAGLADWSIPATLHRLESYNGFGSRKHGIKSPYLWSFSSHYQKGKFVRDGVYDPEAVSKQCGAAVMIKALADSGAIAV